MRIKGPKSPLSGGGPEPLDPRDLQKAVKGENFTAALSQLEAQAATAGAEQASGSAHAARTALEQIASRADLSSEEGAATAVLESAQYLIRSSLGAEYGETEQGLDLSEKLSAYVAAEPLLKTKLLSILRRIKAG